MTLTALSKVNLSNAAHQGQLAEIQAALGSEPGILNRKDEASFSDV